VFFSVITMLHSTLNITIIKQKYKSCIKETKSDFAIGPLQDVCKVCTSVKTETRLLQKLTDHVSTLKVFILNKWVLWHQDCSSEKAETLTTFKFIVLALVAILIRGTEL
jgi:hypothetical protein